jgi:hypothetical protein
LGGVWRNIWYNGSSISSGIPNTIAYIDVSISFPNLYLFDPPSGVVINTQNQGFVQFTSGAWMPSDGIGWSRLMRAEFVSFDENKLHANYPWEYRATYYQPTPGSGLNGVGHQPLDVPFVSNGLYAVLYPSSGDWAGHEGQLTLLSVTDNWFFSFANDFYPDSVLNNMQLLSYRQINYMPVWNTFTSGYDKLYSLLPSYSAHGLPLQWAKLFDGIANGFSYNPPISPSGNPIYLVIPAPNSYHASGVFSGYEGSLMRWDSGWTNLAISSGVTEIWAVGPHNIGGGVISGQDEIWALTTSAGRRIDVNYQPSLYNTISGGNISNWIGPYQNKPASTYSRNGYAYPLDYFTATLMNDIYSGINLLEVGYINFSGWVNVEGYVYYGWQDTSMSGTYVDGTYLQPENSSGWIVSWSGIADNGYTWANSSASGGGQCIMYPVVVSPGAHSPDMSRGTFGTVLISPPTIGFNGEYWVAVINGSASVSGAGWAGFLSQSGYSGATPTMSGQYIVTGYMVYPQPFVYHS